MLARKLRYTVFTIAYGHASGRVRVSYMSSQAEHSTVMEAARCDNNDYEIALVTAMTELV